MQGLRNHIKQLKMSKVTQTYPKHQHALKKISNRMIYQLSTSGDNKPCMHSNPTAQATHKLILNPKTTCFEKPKLTS